jgi:membrane protein DedA with SNARE-associated domain
VKLGQYLFVRHRGKIIFAAQFVPVLRTFAGPFAGANVMPWRDFLMANAVSSGIWAASYGLAAYWTGREFEQLQGRAVVLLVIIGILVIVAGTIFVHRQEDQLIAQAERDAGSAEVALGSRLLLLPPTGVSDTYIGRRSPLCPQG